MKKHFTILTLGLACMLFMGPALAHAQTTGSPGLKCDASGQCTYVPLEPIPGANQTGMGDFASFLSSLFKVLLSLGALIAVATLVFGGIMYMTNEAAGQKEMGKERMKAAIYGLLLLAGSWLILYTINPNLLNFSLTIGQPNTATQTTTTNTPAASSAQNYSASSAVGQDWAQGLGVTLRDTNSAGAVRMVQTADLSKSDVITADNTFNSECTAGGAGVVVTKISGDNTQTVFACKSIK